MRDAFVFLLVTLLVLVGLPAAAGYLADGLTVAVQAAKTVIRRLTK